MQEIIISAFADRLKAGLMDIRQVPEVFRDLVKEKLEEFNVE